jgi:branched-chain amino acid transport system substrate-binding protein
MHGKETGWGWRRVLLAAFLPAVLMGCGPRVVELGAVLPLTGSYSAYGQSLRRGILLAVDEVNREGGVEGRRLDVEIRDSASDPQRALEEFRSLITVRRIPATIGGGTSGETLAMAPLANQFQRILLSPSASSPRITSAGDWVFRNWPSDELEGRTLADFAAYSLHATRLLVLSEQNPYADGVRSVFEERFKAMGRSVRTLTVTAPRSAEDAAQSAMEGLGDAQAVLMVGYGEDLMPLLQAMRARGLDRPVLSVSSMAETTLLRRFAAASEGAIFPRPVFDPGASSPDVRLFVSDYRSRFGEEPDIYAAHAYDAVGILAAVMRGSGVRPQEMRRGLLALRNYEGVAGVTSFDAHGDAIQPLQMCVARDGRAVPLKDVLGDALVPLQKRVEELRFGR